MKFCTFLEHLDVYISRKHLPIVQGTPIDYVTEGLNKHWCSKPQRDR